MIDALRLTLGWALVWIFSTFIVAALSRRAVHRRPGERAWTLGGGFLPAHS